MKHLYIISGPNGAGKTTASFTILPEIFDCKEFVNADEIAKGISPLNPEAANIMAGRVMLDRIDNLMKGENTFAIETTLSNRTHANLVQRAKNEGYLVTLIFLALDSAETAVARVKRRVEEGGHNIPETDIRRRFKNGIINLFNLYMPIVDEWYVIENLGESYSFVAEGNSHGIVIFKEPNWVKLKNLAYGN
ncbi:MAG: zeta toxin family protein [Crocinitomicaceae bacterium]|nr:zeta toxin family protein [Crocinitomicaceae bacterium]